jgi:hypothetical protein
MADSIAVMYAGGCWSRPPPGTLYRRHGTRTRRACCARSRRCTAHGRRCRDPGFPPDLRIPPPGCPFHPRCGFAMESAGRRCRPRSGLEAPAIGRWIRERSSAPGWQGDHAARRDAGAREPSSPIAGALLARAAGARRRAGCTTGRTMSRPNWPHQARVRAGARFRADGRRPAGRRHRVAGPGSRPARGRRVIAGRGQHDERDGADAMTISAGHGSLDGAGAGAAPAVAAAPRCSRPGDHHSISRPAGAVPCTRWTASRSPCPRAGSPRSLARAARASPRLAPAVRPAAEADLGPAAARRPASRLGPRRAAAVRPAGADGAAGPVRLATTRCTMCATT